MFTRSVAPFRSRQSEAKPVEILVDLPIYGTPNIPKLSHPENYPQIVWVGRGEIHTRLPNGKVILGEFNEKEEEPKRYNSHKNRRDDEQERIEEHYHGLNR